MLKNLVPRDRGATHLRLAFNLRESPGKKREVKTRYIAN